MKKNKFLIAAVLSMMMFFLGYEASGFQLTLRLISSEFVSDGIKQGLLVSSQYSAIIIMPILSGFMADKFDKRKIIAAFGILFAVGCAIVIFTSSYSIILFGFFLIGCGYSVCESVSVSLFTYLFAEKANRYVNISQSMFSLGAVVSPLLNSWLINYTDLTWRINFFTAGLFFVLLSVILFVTQAENVKLIVKPKGEKTTQENKAPVLLYFLAGAIFIYAGIEIGLSFFLDSFVVQNFEGLPYSAYILSAFWITMVPSRMLGAYLYKHKQILLTICYAISTFAIILLAINSNIVISFFLTLLVGFSLGPIWPNLMSSALDKATRPGLASGIMSSSCGLGGVIFPMMISYLSVKYNFRYTFLLIGLTALAGLLVVLAHNKAIKTKKLKNNSY